MIYSVVTIVVGVLCLYYAFKWRKEEKNMWDKSMTLKGIIAGILAIILGIVTLLRVGVNKRILIVYQINLASVSILLVC